MIRFFCATTRSGAVPWPGLQVAAPAAREVLRGDQHAKVIARERRPSVVCAMLVSTVCCERASFTPEMRAMVPSLSLLT